MDTVAFIGLGRMGGLMAAHVARAGYPLRAHDTHAHALARFAAGTPCTACATAPEAARGATVLVTMLPDGPAVSAAVRAALPALDEGALVIDMSSADPYGTRELATALAARGIALVDAPVSGAKARAAEATLAIMAGGETADFERARPILATMGNELFHVGPVGAGHALKALNNYLGAAGTIAGFEALLVGQAFGLDPARMVEVINASTGKNSTTERKIPQQVLTGAFASGFSAALMTKDLGIAAGLAEALGVETPYLRDTLSIWREALARLPPGADHTELFHYLRALKPPAH
ncbi:MAG TPA: NAD(P)-dependent oxidoreductase [Burkholderiales bacterium]